MVRFEQARDKTPIRTQALWIVLWLAVTVVAFFLRPDRELHGTHQQLGLPPCPSVAFFDRPCFGCGLTTSFAATVHLDFATAFRAHPLGSVLYFLLTATAFVTLWASSKGLRVDSDTKAFNRASLALLVAFVAFGVYRFSTVEYGSQEFKIAEAGRSLGGEKGR
jgi:hypothetical protein